MAAPTRREFLATTSLALVGTLAGARRLEAQILPKSIWSSGVSAKGIMPAALEPLDLHALTAAGVDAARQAGASYADIRVGEEYRLEVNWRGLVEPGCWMSAYFRYGVRVLVDGTWMFVHGSVPTVDAIAEAARNAVATAKSCARLTKRPVELAPTPVVTGEWSVPIREDPFAVSIEEQGEVLDAYWAASHRVWHSSWGPSPLEFHWDRITRAFASTEGSRTMQTLWRATPDVRVRGNYGMLGEVGLRIQRLAGRSAGFEYVREPGWQDEIKAVNEETVRLVALPHRRLDVGRYPVVMDGATLGMILGSTLGTATELDRVLGYEAGASGTSYLSPPSKVLGTQIASPLLTVTGHRAAPSVCAVKWDDEGVEAREFPVITEGRLVGYANSRQTAAELAGGPGQVNPPAGPHGCMVAPAAADPVLVRPPELKVSPGAKAATIEDLCREVTEGVLVLDNHDAFTTDQQLATGSLNFLEDRQYKHQDGVMLKIEKGKVVALLDDLGLEFKTAQFWKTLQVLGDASTVRDVSFEMQKGMPWRTALQSVTAPAGLFKEVNVVSTAVIL